MALATFANPWHDEIGRFAPKGTGTMHPLAEQMADWETSKPWNLTKEEAIAQTVPGFRHKEARETETASWDGKHIRTTDEFYALPEETRRAIAYHEAGHAMLEAAGGLTTIEDPLDLIDKPGGQALGHNAEEILAEGYSALWSDPDWFDRMDAHEIRGVVIAAASRAGFPLPEGVTPDEYSAGLWKPPHTIATSAVSTSTTTPATTSAPTRAGSSSVPSLGSRNVCGSSARASFANPWHDEIGRFAPKGTGRMFGASQGEMRSLFDPVRPLVDVLEAAGGKTYLVGGSVRDRLTGIDAKDIDIEVHDLPVEDTIRLLTEQGARIDEVGKAFGVLKVTFNGETHDFSFPRTEVKTGEGHTGFDVTVDPNLGIEQALARRDFTMNALAVDSDGNLVDPFGGVDDLRNGVLRHVGPAFSEDPLRILRGVQFAARFGFTFDPDTARLARDLVPELENISTERVWGEFEKLGGKGTSMEAAARALRDVGLDRRYGPIEFTREPDLAGLDGDHRAAVALASIGVDPAAIGAPRTVARTMADVYTALDFDGDPAASRTLARDLKFGTFADAARIAGPNDNVDPRVLDGPLPSLVDGNDVMARGVRGPAIGEVLRAVQRAQDNETIATREEALEWLDRHAQTSTRHRAEFANPWHDEAGRFAPKGSGRHFAPRGGANAHAQSVAEAMATRARLNGGFTFDPRGNVFVDPDPSLPREDQRGAVAVPGHSAIIKMDAFRDPERGKQFIRDYLDQHADTIASEPDIFIGGWHDTANGEVVLDLSQVRPLDEAIQLGVERGEQAIFNLDTLEDVATHGTGGRENVKIVDASGRHLVRFGYGSDRGPPSPQRPGRHGSPGRLGGLGEQVRGGEAGDRRRPVRGSEFANPWHDEVGRFAEKGTGRKSDGRSSEAEEAAAKKLARDKARKVPKPTEDDIIQGQVDALLAREGLVRAGGDRRGNNTARKRRAKQLVEEFGDGETCPCVDCGQRLAADSATADKLGIDALTQDKILVGTLGGSYKLENLIPACPPCNQSRGDREGVGVVGNVRQSWGSAERHARQVVRENGEAIAKQFQTRRSAILKRKGITIEEHLAREADALPADWDKLRRPVGGSFAAVERFDGGFVNGDAAHHELRVDDAVRVDIPREQLALDGRVIDGVVEVLGIIPPEPLGPDHRAVLKNHRHHRSEFANPWHDEIGRFAPKGTGTNYANIASRAREAEAAGSQISDLDLDSAATLRARLGDFITKMGFDFEHDDGVLMTMHAINQRHGKGAMNGLAATNPDGVVLGAIAYTVNKDPGRDPSSPSDYHIEFLGSTGLVKGVGSQLVIPVMERAAADGAKVTLKVAGTKSAAPFWESLGFERDWEGATGATMLPADVKAWVANIAREREGVLVGAGPAPEGWDPDDDRWAARAIELGLMSPIVASAAQFMNPWHDEIGRFAPKGTGRKFDSVTEDFAEPPPGYRPEYQETWRAGYEYLATHEMPSWWQGTEILDEDGLPKREKEVAQDWNHKGILEEMEAWKAEVGEAVADGVWSIGREAEARRKYAIRVAISTNQIDLDAAKERWGEYDTKAEGNWAEWEDLPQTLYHATSAMSAIESSGTLMTRGEIGGRKNAAGLGGGTEDTISFTSDRAVAEGIARSLHEVRRAVTMDNDMLRAELEERAGDWWNDVAEGFRSLTGRQPDAISSIEDRYELYRTFIAYREQHEGVLNPLFFNVDVDRLASMNPDEIGIVTVKPAMEGARGYQVSALGEWRTPTGAATEITELEHLDDHQTFTVIRQFANPWHDEIGRFAPKGTGRKFDGGEVVDPEEADAAFAEKYGNERRSGEGDCFQAAAHYIVSIPREDEDRYRVVHGVVRGQGPLDGIYFDHAWIERTDPLPPEIPDEMREAFERYEMNVTVIDKSNGNDVEMIRSLYYNIGDIDQRDVTKYTIEEAKINMVKTGVYGPWK